MKHIPKSECTEGDGQAVESLRPAVRRQWLQDNPLPDSIRYYSLVTYPSPDQVSSSSEEHAKETQRHRSQE